MDPRGGGRHGHEVTDLQKDLEELSATLPGLPDRVRELLEGAQELGAASSKLQGELQAARVELAKSLAAAHASLPHFETRLQSLREHLDVSGDGVAQTWQSSQEGLAKAVDAAEAAADSADLARLDLQRGVVDWTARVTAADVNAATTPVQHAAQEARAHIGAAAEAAAEKAAQLRDAVRAMQEPLATAALALQERLVAVTSRVVGQAGFLCLEEFHHRLSADALARAAVADGVKSAVEALVGDLEARLGALQASVARSIEGALATTALNPAMEAYAVDVVVSRGAALERLGEIGEATASLPDVYLQVETAANLIGQP